MLPLYGDAEIVFWLYAGVAANMPAGYMWQMPQWYPMTSMAAFPGPTFQYAAQQSADTVEVRKPWVWDT